MSEITAGILSICNLPIMVLILLGTFMGIIVGAIPGLSVTMGCCTVPAAHFWHGSNCRSVSSLWIVYRRNLWWSDQCDPVKDARYCCICRNNV